MVGWFGLTFSVRGFYDGIFRIQININNVAILLKVKNMTIAIIKVWDGNLSLETSISWLLPAQVTDSHLPLPSFFSPCDYFSGAKNGHSNSLVPNFR